MGQHTESLCAGLTSPEHTVSGKCAAMDSGFQMTSDQLGDS